MTRISTTVDGTRYEDEVEPRLLLVPSTASER